MKNITSIILLTLFFVSANAQTKTNDSIPIKKTKKEFWEHVGFGGGIGLGFGNGYTNLGISPSAIYRFNDYFASGIGLNVNYVSVDDQFSDYNSTVFGGSIITLFKPIEEIQLSLEFEESKVNFKNKISGFEDNYWYPALYVGGGYAIGDFGAIGLRYDVLYDEDKSYYGTAVMPFIRVFF